MPGLNGLEVCRRLRATKNTPIIMLTARDSIMDRVTGLDSGADDYLPKPFAIEELLARMRVIFRREEHIENKQVSFLTFKDLQLQIESRTITKGNEEIELTNKEFELLLMFMKILIAYLLVMFYWTKYGDMMQLLRQISLMYMFVICETSYIV